MKRSIIGMALIVMATSLNAQNLSLGFTTGFGHSWTNSETGPFDRRFHPSYNLGGRLVYSFVSNWGVSGDIKFSSEGQTIGEDGDNKTVGRANYIRIPVQGIYFLADTVNA